MLECEGYRMFYGTMLIVPAAMDSFTVTGTWLYKPDTECWYCNGQSFPAEVTEIIEEEPYA